MLVVRWLSDRGELAVGTKAVGVAVVGNQCPGAVGIVREGPLVAVGWGITRASPVPNVRRTR